MVSYCFLLFLMIFCCFLLVLMVSCCFLLFLIVIYGLSWFLIVSYGFLLSRMDNEGSISYFLTWQSGSGIELQVGGAFSLQVLTQNEDVSNAPTESPTRSMCGFV